MSETDTVAAICGSAHFAYSLLSNLRGIIGEDSDLCPLVFKEQDAAAIFRGEDDPFANRPLIITAFPLGIQYFPVIHSKYIVRRGLRIIVPQYLSSWPLASSEEKTEANQQQHNRDQEALQRQIPVSIDDRTK